MAVIQNSLFRTVSISSASWMRFMNSEEEKDFADEIRFFGFFEAPEVPDSDGDFEIRAQFGDRLDAYAHKFYGDQFLWWVIALANDMDLPILQLNPGDTVIITDPVVVRSNFVRR